MKNYWKIYGFTYRLDLLDTKERIAEFIALSEEDATKKFKKFLKKEGLIFGESLGELKEEQN